MKSFQKKKQEELYSKMMGELATERQKREAIKVKGGCVCNKYKLKKRWDGLHLSERTIHEPSCPLHRWWMTEDNLRSIERDGS